MDKKTSPGGTGAIGGKGFYIVLFLCAAVVGVSAWILLSDVGTNVEELEAAQKTVDISDAYVTIVPQGTKDEPVIIETQPAVEVSSDAEEPMITEQPETRAVFSETVTNYVWPVRGDIEVPYSMETLRYDATMADWRTHDGIDIACTLGDEVLATAGGTVVSVRQDDMYGTVVEIDHANGVHSIYANLASEPPVGEGDLVTMGQTIGSVGKTALAETNEIPHLHLSMTLDGRSVNPMDYLDSAFIENE